MPSDHRLRRGLLGYLILFAPHAVVIECQDRTSELPSHLVFWSILTHFTTTPTIPLASSDLEFRRIRRWRSVELIDLPTDAQNHRLTLYAQ